MELRSRSLVDRSQLIGGQRLSLLATREPSARSLSSSTNSNVIPMFAASPTHKLNFKPHLNSFIPRTMSGLVVGSYVKLRLAIRDSSRGVESASSYAPNRSFTFHLLFLFIIIFSSFSFSFSLSLLPGCCCCCFKPHTTRNNTVSECVYYVLCFRCVIVSLSLDDRLAGCCRY